MRAPRYALAGLALAALAAQAGAQRPAEPFGESIDVSVVNVETVVTDGRGARVKGLTREDFQLFVDGREVPVEFFAEIAGGRAAPASAEETSLPPDTLPGEAVPRSFLIYIDEETCIAAHRNMVLGGLARDVRGLGAADQVAVVAFNGRRLDVLSNWTGDKEAVAAVLEEARKRPSNGISMLASRRSGIFDSILADKAAKANDPDAGGDPAAEGEIGPGAGFSVSPKEWSDLSRATSAAAAALRGFAKAPGRKAMVLLAGGWPVGRLAVPVVLEANRLGYTLYPVDVQGTDTAIVNSDVIRDSPVGTFEVFTSGWEKASDGMLEWMAGETGGKASLNSTRLDALARAAEDARDYYWLGFTPDWKGDSRAHHIEVRLRRPELTARARGGFWDLSRAALNEITAEGILDVGGDPGSRRLVLEAGPPQPVKGRRMNVPLTVAVPTELLLAVPEGDSQVYQGTLTVRSRDSKGRVSFHPDVRFSLQVPEAPKPGSFGRQSVTLNLPQSDQHLVVTLRDAASGAVVWGECDVKARREGSR